MAYSFVLSCVFLAIPFASASPLARSPDSGLGPVRIVQGNDDGWYEGHARATYYSLQEAGYDTILCATPVDQSGSGSKDAPPTVLRQPGQYGSLPVGAPPKGPDPNSDRIYYHNSFPVTAMKFSLTELSPSYFGSLPDLVVTGPRVGNLLGVDAVKASAAVAAANAALQMGVPALVFSGASGPHKSWKDIKSLADPSIVYGGLAMMLVNAITSSKPFLPTDVGLNINFPSTNDCPSVYSYRFILSRMTPDTTTKDVFHCQSDHLPTEAAVSDMGRCSVSISGFTADSRKDISAATQAIIRDKLSHILSCP